MHRIKNFYTAKKLLKSWGVEHKQFGIGHKPVYEIDPSLYFFILPTSNSIRFFYRRNPKFNVHELRSSSIFVKTSTKMSRSFLQSSSSIPLFWAPDGSTWKDVKLSVFKCSLRIISSTLENLSLARQLCNQKLKLESIFLKTTSNEESERRNQSAKLYFYNSGESFLSFFFYHRSSFINFFL